MGVVGLVTVYDFQLARTDFMLDFVLLATLCNDDFRYYNDIFYHDVTLRFRKWMSIKTSFVIVSVIKRFMLTKIELLNKC